jgi:hypothetical protein
MDYMTSGEIKLGRKSMITFMVRMRVLVEVEVEVCVIKVDGLALAVAVGRKKWLGVCAGTLAIFRWASNPLARDTCYWQSPCVSRDLAVPLG